MKRPSERQPLPAGGAGTTERVTLLTELSKISDVRRASVIHQKTKSELY